MELILLHLLGAVPGYKVSSFSVISLSCQAHLGANQQDLAIEEHDSRIIEVP